MDSALVFIVPHGLITTAFVAAVLYSVPVAFPFLSPGEWFLATRTDFRGQIRFVSGKWHIKKTVGT